MYVQLHAIDENNGVELPWLSRAVMDTYQFSGVLLLIGLAPCVMLLTKRSFSLETRIRLGKLVTLGYFIAWASMLTALLATYLPMMLAAPRIG